MAPGAALNWLSAELAGHEFGVDADEARAERPAYRPGDAVNVELGLGMTAEWGGAWLVIVNGSAEFLANELRESPLVERDNGLTLGAAIIWRFARSSRRVARPE